ncbi:MAG TPA: hypothetical protein VL461_01145 [Dictyobacter sp.]|jgi:hypothetical protein|nr:hypothetical protein [Dictyobacter sp.]
MSERRRESVSEVARLRQQIADELVAMDRGFHAYAAGTSRHEFIRAKMERIGDQQDKLAQYVGQNDAEHMVCELYMDSVVHNENDTNKPGDAVNKG